MKKLIVLMLVLVMILTIAGCNYQTFDTTVKFDKAIIGLPDGTVVEGEVASWRDFEDGDQIQVRIDDKTYLTHISNVILVREHKKGE